MFGTRSRYVRHTMGLLLPLARYDDGDECWRKGMLKRMERVWGWRKKNVSKQKGCVELLRLEKTLPGTRTDLMYCTWQPGVRTTLRFLELFVIPGKERWEKWSLNFWTSEWLRIPAATRNVIAFLYSICDMYVLHWFFICANKKQIPYTGRPKKWTVSRFPYCDDYLY